MPISYRIIKGKDIKIRLIASTVGDITATRITIKTMNSLLLLDRVL
jgi:hypothetical protein